MSYSIYKTEDTGANMSLFYDDSFIDFYIEDLNLDNMTITVTMCNLGKITQDTFDLYEDEEKNYYFEYGIYRTKVFIDYCEEAENETNMLY